MSQREESSLGLRDISRIPSRSKSPLTLNLAHEGEEGETSLVLHHADESDDDVPRSPPRSPVSPNTSTGERGTADKAGVILGIHNVFLVLPQFIVTFLASIIFYLMEPDKGMPAKHPQAIPIGNATITGMDEVAAATAEIAARVWKREGIEAGSPDAVGLIFR
jgi:solute carrier family 45 protein 1/2/4